jgi:hypothetical protein
MNDKRRQKESLEVSSQSLKDELVAIKDRLSVIETIQGISNAIVVKRYVEEHLKTKDAKKIMAECAEARTRSHLQAVFGYKSKQALDHHLKPLRDAILLRERIDDDGTLVLEWSNTFRSLPKSTIRSILNDEK